MTNRRPHSRTVPMRAADLELEREALDLKLNGASYRAIADHQQCSVSTAHDRVDRALASLVPVETAERVRQQETERYEAVQARVLAALGAHTQPRQDDAGRDVPPDPDSVAKLVASFVRVADRKAKLLGLDLPVTQHLKVSSSDLDAEVQALVDELAQAAQGQPVPQEDTA